MNKAKTWSFMQEYSLFLASADLVRHHHSLLWGIFGPVLRGPFQPHRVAGQDSVRGGSQTTARVPQTQRLHP